MKHFILRAAPALWSLASQLNISVPTLMKLVRERQRQEVWLWQEDDLDQTLPEVQEELALLEALNQLCGTHKQQLSDCIHHCSSQWLRQLTPLPLLMLCEETPHPVACKLAKLLEAPASDRIKLISTNEVQQLKVEREAIRVALSRTTEILGGWLDTYLAETLDEESLDDICGRLPTDFGQLRDLQEINATLHTIVSDQARSNKVKQIRTLWKEITGTESPGDWCEFHCIPIQWVLQGVKVGKFVEALNQPERYKDATLQNVLDHLDKNRNKLSNLNDPGFIDRRFLEAVAWNYKALLSEDGVTLKLRKHLQKKFGHPSGWPGILGKINEEISTWIKAHYQQYLFRQVASVIEELPLNQAKERLMELAEDPMVGAKLCNYRRLKKDPS